MERFSLKRGTMKTRLYSWKVKIQQHPSMSTGIVLISLFALALIVVVVLGYWFDWAWTGFGAYKPPLNAGTLQPGKTLWDWLQLLIVPVVLALGGVWLNQVQKSREERKTQQQAKLEHELAQDNHQEVLLQTYIDKMSEILLEKRLRTSQPEDEVRKIARVRTLMVLSRLDGVRKGSVLQFLHESGLIEGTQPIMRLSGADLSKTDLREADLQQANLRDANLRQAILSRSDLRGAILSKTNLQGADLHGTILKGADLSAADLQDADLQVADLQGAILLGTDLRRAVLSSAQLASVKNAQAIILS
jgi:hypothetical protein